MSDIHIVPEMTLNIPSQPDDRVDSVNETQERNNADKCNDND